MANNLKDHLKEVADAIRAKKGTSDLINPQDFATEIEGISGGGSGEGGGSNIEYLDVSGMQDYMKNVLLYYSVLAKIQGDSVTYGVQIQPSGFLLAAGGMTSLVTAVAIDLVIPITKYASEESGVEKQELTTLDADSEFMEMLDTIPRLTKEQFYNLNA